MSSNDPGVLTQHTIPSEGLTLSVWEGPASGEPVLFVHGYPDTHRVWLPVVSRLADRFHCITYDVRGAGDSDAPDTRAEYGLAHLVTDLVAVMDAVSPQRPVHLVGHDWGSIQCWEAVLTTSSDPRLRGRISSFTSISGPPLEHMAAFFASSWRGRWAERRVGLRQLARSSYAFAFCVPLLPELWLRRTTRDRAPGGGGRRSWHFGPTLPADARHGLGLYRANLFHRRPAGRGATTTVPVQLLVPVRDKYVAPEVYRDLEYVAPDLTRHDLDAGHWVQQSQADEVATLIADFVTH